jgi:hypothetical protein
MSPSIEPSDFGFNETQMLLLSLFIENKCKDVIRARERELARDLDAQLTEAYADGRDDERQDWIARQKEFNSLIPAKLT